MFQYSGTGENPFSNDPLFEGNSFNTKSNLFKNYVNILSERENFNKGILSHPKKEILDQNDRKRFELTDHDNSFEKPNKIMSKVAPSSRNTRGNDSFLKSTEEDDQMRGTFVCCTANVLKLCRFPEKNSEKRQLSE